MRLELTTKEIIMNKTSKIIIKSIWTEDLFKWFYYHVMDVGGDGGGAIISGNPEETSDLFIEWYKKRYNEDHFFHPKQIDKFGIISYGDGNEYFLFHNKLVKLFPYEYQFIIKEDCYFGPTYDQKDVVKRVEFNE